MTDIRITVEDIEENPQDCDHVLTATSSCDRQCDVCSCKLGKTYMDHFACKDCFFDICVKCVMRNYTLTKKVFPKKVK